MKNLKSHEINMLMHLIGGYSENLQDGTKRLVCNGLKREIGLTEGTRRILNKILKELESEFKLIEEAKKEAGEDEARQKEIDEMDYNVNLSEEFLFSKVQDLNFSFDYSNVYQLLCSDY